jgi:PmbA protein
MGFGFNAATGHFSPAANGFWIEGGALAFPVSDVAISLNIGDLFQADRCRGKRLVRQGKRRGADVFASTR